MIGPHAQNLINHFRLSSQHNWEDLSIQLNNQHTCTFDDHNRIKGDPILNPIFGDASP